MAYKNCFLIDTQSTYNAVFITPSLHSFSNLSTGPTLPLIDALMETILKNRIRVFRDTSAVKQISNLVAEYPLSIDLGVSGLYPDTPGMVDEGITEAW